MGIMMEHRSSNRKGITSSSYQGASAGYCTYHCWNTTTKYEELRTPNYTKTSVEDLLCTWQCMRNLTFLASVSFQTFPATPRTRTTTIWKTNIAPVNLSIIASIAVSFGSAIPLLIPSLVWLPIKDEKSLKTYKISTEIIRLTRDSNNAWSSTLEIYFKNQNQATFIRKHYLYKQMLHMPTPYFSSNRTEAECFLLLTNRRHCQ